MRVYWRSRVIIWPNQKVYFHPITTLLGVLGCNQPTSRVLEFGLAYSRSRMR